MNTPDTPTPTDPREEKKPKVFLVTMRARKNDGATETVSFRSGIFACESEAHAKVAMLEGREPEFSIDELDAKPFDTTFLTAPLESTNSKLAAEIAELQLKLAAIGEFAVTDWDEPTVGKIDALVKEPIKYKDRLRALFVDIPKERDTLRAELEAVKMDLETAQTSADNYWRELEAARKERDEVRESHRREIGRLIEQRDGYMDVARRESLAAVDALAAKDAAEKHLSEVAKAWENGGGFALAEACRALTPAPTQEPPAGKLPIGTKIRFLKTLYSPPNEEHPYLVYAHKDETGEITGHNDFEGYFVRTDRWQTPFGASLGTEFEPLPPAGGVTISNETVGIIPTATTLTEASPDVSTLGAEAASHPSTSPADVPSEGRGEYTPSDTIEGDLVREERRRMDFVREQLRKEQLLPFNLSDAIAGKPVVTRNGKSVTGFKEIDHIIYPVFGLIDESYAYWTKKGEHYHGIETDWDLFMLPTEGSGA